MAYKTFHNSHSLLAKGFVAFLSCAGFSCFCFVFGLVKIKTCVDRETMCRIIEFRVRVWSSLDKNGYIWRFAWRRRGVEKCV